MNTAGLATEQAPPLAVPLGFYALLPLALLAGGGLLAWHGAALLASHWSPLTIAWTHLGTLGLLLAAMLGSLYQLVPVVLGVPVPGIRLAHAVALALALGTAALVGGLLAGLAPLVLAGGGLLTLALAGFLLPVTRALMRARAGGPTATGIRGAVTCLLLVAIVGLRLAWGHGTGALPDARQTWLTVHVALGLIGWVGGLTTAVAWQIVPMFYLAPPLSPRLARLLASLAPGSALLTAALALGGSPLLWVLLAALPGAVGVWLVQPVLLAWHIAHRRRRRRDPTLQFWWLALGCAPLTLLTAVLAVATDWPPAPVLFGWLAVVGWGGALVHGVLLRIVPFLVWFHAFTHAAGQRDVPPMKRLLPDAQAAWNLRAHAAAVLSGAVAIGCGGDWLARAAGGLLAVVGLLLGAALASTLWRAR